MPPTKSANDIDAFIARWAGTERAERANYALFLTELCATLGIEPPQPASGGLGDYRFERSVTHREPDGRETTRRIDLYKRGCFILEAKQGAREAVQLGLLGEKLDDRRANIRNSRGWALHMEAARNQAESYSRDLPAEEGYPPFLIICDVGFCFDLYANFTGDGKYWAQYPDAKSFRIFIEDLRNPTIRARLAAVFTDPQSLDPSRHRVQVTREIAALLAKLARALETRHTAEAVSSFLMRAIFCMFAQSVGLLPSPTGFTELLQRCQREPVKFVPLVGDLWRSMSAGGFCVALEASIKRFNGALYGFSPHGAAEPLALDAAMIALLVSASQRDWANVEPAIFGTLLENALDARTRGQLGAHFTPRAFVERLVQPTVMEPLRAEWDGVKAAALERAEANDREEAGRLIRAFLTRLCAVRVLDPACGTGNFLYVTMELMKRLEGEVLELLSNVVRGEGARLALAGASVDPHQFYGLEKNPRAVPVAELVLWIGYLQFHFRTHGGAPPAEPILRDFKNIRETDALLDYALEEIERDAAGQPISRWDGVSFKTHPITGENVPDETMRHVVMRPVKPRAAIWPEAEFIVGNPPFIAGKDLRAELGDGYAEALWNAYPKVPRSADIAMFFWWKAAQAVAANKSVCVRFGFITSNSIRQVFCRRVIADALAGRRKLRLVFAIPDHPWADGEGTAAVRIAMTTAELASRAAIAPPRLQTVVAELQSEGDAPAVVLATVNEPINADLSTGADANAAEPLRANEALCSRGMSLHGSGFIVTPAQAKTLGLGRVKGLEAHIRPYLNGRDLTSHSRNVMVIDLFGLTEAEVRRKFPDVWQHLASNVKPQRDAIAANGPDAAQYAAQWWLHGKPRPELRKALAGLPRYIATVETAKHRALMFLSGEVVPDNRLVCFAFSDAYSLGVLSSHIHVVWALASGGLLEDRPIYTKTCCFDPFPFPTATAAQRRAIGTAAEELDALRKSRLAAHPDLTLTGLYNVLEKLRAATPLTEAERDIHDAGHVSILRELHDRIDREVAAAYGWRPDLTAAEIVTRLVALNAERRAEEQDGKIRWLRPDFQAGAEIKQATQRSLDVEEADDATLPAWPKGLGEQYLALRAALTQSPGTPQDLARRFRNAKRPKIADMLEALAALGQARKANDGRYYV